MFCVLYSMIITDVTAVVLEVLCAKYFLMKKTLKNGNRTGTQVNPIFTNVYICCRYLEPVKLYRFFHREEGCDFCCCCLNC